MPVCRCKILICEDVGLTLALIFYSFAIVIRITIMRGLRIRAVAAGILLTIATNTPCLAQNSTSELAFDTYEWDFGTIREADGPVSHVFTFKNTGDKAIIIENVKVDCGCTTPRYSREPVRPGGSGTIEVVFDPEKFSGAFTKGVTIYSGRGRNRNLLKVTGSVIGRPLSVEEEFPFSLTEGMRADALYRAFGYVENGAVKSMTVELANVSGMTAFLKAIPDSGSGYLEVFVPQSIEAGGRGTVTVTYDLSDAENVYGILTDRAYISVNGQTAALPINTSAIAVDDFSSQDLSVAAACRISPAYRNFGSVKAGDELILEFTVYNEGKSPLVIRSVSPRRGTRTTLKTGDTVMPGSELKATASVTVSAEDYGAVSGGVSIIVNDPARPFREVRIGADAE